MQVYTYAKSLTFHGVVTTKSPVNAAPVIVWECQHLHTDAIEAELCANNYLKEVLNA